MDTTQLRKNKNHIKPNTRLVTLFILMLMALLSLIAIYWCVSELSNHESRVLQRVGDLRVSTQLLRNTADQAVVGHESAFVLLRTTKDNIDGLLKKINEQMQKRMLDVDRAERQSMIDDIQNNWSKIRLQTDVVLNHQDAILTIRNHGNNILRSITDLQIKNDELVNILLTNDATADQVSLAQNQSLLVQRIAYAIQIILNGDDSSPQAAEDFAQDALMFDRIVQGLMQGDQDMSIPKVTDDEANERLDEIAKDFNTFVSNAVNEIVEKSPAMLEAKQATTQMNASILKQSQDLLALQTNAQEAFDDVSHLIIAGYALLAFLLVLLGYIAYSTFLVSQRLIETASAKNERNQVAILRLLNEIEGLAIGDLTVQATVSEDFTGAIADSINHSIDQLRALVTTIHKTSWQVAAAVGESKATALQLEAASDHQAQEIAGASAAINEIAVSIDQVSANAAESAAVAERSVSIANKGNEVVHNTINGMDNIREQIQDTSKRIKRLGESSQEIGDIISLINDIADQTNILALNAAIQASMAGEAGRGFAVVADEVQRLAERSSIATKQIEALVKTIQTDTNEAVISMEQTTTEVVRGARLAQDAGVALEEIEKVSKTLAALIQNISNAAKQQASSAGHISSTMSIVQEITSQTSAGTTITARNIANLSKLADELRKSVSDFTLPPSNHST